MNFVPGCIPSASITGGGPTGPTGPTGFNGPTDPTCSFNSSSDITCKSLTISGNENITLNGGTVNVISNVYITNLTGTNSNFTNLNAGSLSASNIYFHLFVMQYRHPILAIYQK